MPTITVTSAVGPNDSNFSPKDTSVLRGASVTLKAPGGPLDVYTFLKDSHGQWQSSTVFTSGAPPYSATTAGAPYTLIHKLEHIHIKISLRSSIGDSDEDIPMAGVNGTINVGGGGTDPL